MPISDEIRLANPGKLLDLFVIDFSPIGVNEQIYMYRGVDADNQNILFQGDTYEPWPIDLTGFEKKGIGPESRPKISISNYLGLITQYAQTANDIIGAKVMRKRTLAKYLGTSIADETAFSKEVYYIEQKSLETSTVIEFDLSSPLDFIDRKLPSRICVANSCQWSYKSVIAGSGCGWSGTDSGKWFDRYGISVVTQGEDVCGKRLADCKLRFGENEPLDFGGFPSLGRV